MAALQEILPGIKQNIPLAPYTSLRVGGPADFLFEAKTSDDIVRAVKAAQEAGLPYIILGSGTNVLVSDQGFRGLVILARNNNLRIEGQRIIAEAGVPLGVLVNAAAKEGLSGLEWAAGLPGTFGGAIFGNAGTFGHAIGELVQEVRVLQIQNPKFQTVTIPNGECYFGYRNSAFKKTGDIILEGTLKLEKGDPAEIKAGILKGISYRSEHHPAYQSAGCIFKNTETQHYHKVSLADIEAAAWFERIPSGWLIDHAGLKGTKIGGALIAEKHGNFLMNTGNASAEDVVILISLIKNAVHKKFGVLLEEEIRYLGF